MKILIVTLWCLVPVGLLAYHYGPGKEQLTLDNASASLSEADAAGQRQDAKARIAALEKSLSQLPKDRVHEARRIRLELAKTRMESAQLPEARLELAELAKEVQGDSTSPADLVEDTLGTLAHSRFYLTYLMKLEGLPDTEWEPEIEAARQEQKLLTQLASKRGDSEAAKRHADDLESSIRLARMEPEELYGKAIPKPCQNCNSGKCSNPKPGNKPGKKPSDSRSAGAGAPMDGEGS